MNNLSYETFIRICQGCLININGTSPHFSNHFLCLPFPLFFLSTRPLLHGTSFLLFYSISHLSALSFSCDHCCFTLISSIFTSTGDAVPMRSCLHQPTHPSPPSAPFKAQHLHPPPSSPSHFPHVISSSSLRSFLLLPSSVLTYMSSLPSLFLHYADDSLHSLLSGPHVAENRVVRLHSSLSNCISATRSTYTLRSLVWSATGGVGRP